MNKTFLAIVGATALGLGAALAGVTPDGGQGRWVDEWRGNGVATHNPHKASKDDCPPPHAVPEGGAGLVGIAAMAGIVLLGARRFSLA